MQLNEPVNYLAIAILGSVIAAMYYFIGENPSTAFLIVFMTVSILTGSRFLLERNHYRKYNAILASLEFILLPFSMFLIGIILAPRINYNNYGYLYLDLPRLNVILTASVISLILLIPLVVLSKLMYYYHNRIWLGIAISGKIYHQRRVPATIHLALLLIIGGLVHYLFIVDINAVLFVIIGSYQLGKYYVKPWLRPQNPRRVSQRSKIDEFLSNAQKVKRYPSSQSVNQAKMVRTSGIASPIRQNRSTKVKSNPIQSQSNKPNQRSQAKSRNGIQTGRQSTTRNKQSSKTLRSNVANIDQGKEIKLVSTNNTSLQNTGVLPEGHITKSDLSCIICYDEFSNAGNVVLCKYCKFPMHEREYVAWMQDSNLCPRCSKALPASYIRNPAYRLSAKEYVKKYVNKLQG